VDGGRAPRADHAPGPVRRGALAAYSALPRPVRIGLVRLLTPNFTVGALCLLEHDGALLMLQQRHRHGWTLPGGLVDRGEDAATAATRELLEETGLRVQLGEPLCTLVEPAARQVDVLFHVPVSHRPPVRPSSEATLAAWLDPAGVGQVDQSTAQALAGFARARRPGAQVGRLLPG
jgi:8-oxo-dGTP diphosphatase